MTDYDFNRKGYRGLRYPSKHEVNAMAKRLVEYYPMIKDRSSSSNTEVVVVSEDNCMIAIGEHVMGHLRQ
ncbi:hypothetical protein AAFF_G00231290 [Aldrovandia affinis]|uniref:Uncharacterized protein n=1 Tax=Aldrovandia affinis TaxID=143900 RepID=A0AAD7RHZ4_9TELE|nr:hypothetical protein AAFF_G00231290 [Aldrovandia affinis]